MKAYLLSFIREQSTQKYKNQEQLYESLMETIAQQREIIMEKEKQLQQSKLKALKKAKKQAEKENKQRQTFLMKMLLF